MEILKENFEASLPLLQKAIAECDFVAMDTEMTGKSSRQTWSPGLHWQCVETD